jgi:phospholipid N-methyltransferase
VFVGKDTVSGPLRILIREEDEERCLKIIEENSIQDNNVQEEIEKIIEEKEERKENNNGERRLIYFAYLLTGLSFLIIPYIINIYILTRLAKTKRVPAILLFIVSTVFGVISSVFLVKASL